MLFFADLGEMPGKGVQSSVKVQQRHRTNLRDVIRHLGRA